jgi:hypothetical protein
MMEKLANMMGRIWRMGAVAFFALMAAVFVAQWVIFAGCTLPEMGIVKAVLCAVGDAVLILSVYWIIPNRYKWIMMIPAALVTLFFYANALHFSVYEDYIESSQYAFWRSINRLVINSAIGITKFQHVALWILFLIEPVMYFAHFRRRLRQEKPMGNKAKVVGAVASLAVFVLTQVCYSLTYDSDIDSDSHGGLIANTRERFCERSVYKCRDFSSNGLAVFIVKEAAIGTNSHSKLSDEEIAEIQEYNAETRRLYVMPDSVFRQNVDKNLILLVVESLNDWAVERCLDGRQVMPNLCALAHGQGSIYAPHVTCQARRGMSSDGQLMYVTGLLPTLDVSVAFNYGDNTFPSLPMRFGDRECFEIIGEERDVWNHEKTNRSFGYGALYDVNDIARSAGIKVEECGDFEILRYTAQRLASTRQPFYVMVSSVSMHLPYDTCPERTWISSVKGLGDEERNYLEKAAYFDRALGEFINSLKACGLYDNSVIVIAGDHTMMVDGVDCDLESSTSFVAVNTGYTKVINTRPGQIDIFPTILDIMWLSPESSESLKSPESSWLGMGLSILNPRATASLTDRFHLRGTAPSDILRRLKSAWTLSQDIIKSDYFRFHPDSSR